MELDSRIIEGKKPLTCFDTEQAKEFLGKECYFSNCKVHYKNLSAFEKFESLTDYCIGTLTAIMDLGDRVFDVDQQCKEFRYCLPCEWVKPEELEKKYRPFTGIEFAEKFNLKLNSIIHLRTVPANDKCCYNYKVVFAGYRWDNNDVFEVFLNGWWVGLQDLLRRYEYEENGEWHKFGVEE